jgi:hypothetical protein
MRNRLGTIRKPQIMKIYLVTFGLCCLIFTCCSQIKSTNNNTESQLDSNYLVTNSKWYYTGYTDSTIKYRQLDKYSWSCAYFAYEIEFSDKFHDSCYFRGYDEQYKTPVKKINENIYMAGSQDNYWILTFMKDLDRIVLKLNQSPKVSENSVTKSKTFLFYKKNIDIEDEQTYFAKNIFSGDYLDLFQNRSIRLKDDLSVSGFDIFNKYRIMVNPMMNGTTMDIITFKNEKGDFKKSYNWVFRGDTLILRSLIEIGNEFGDLVDTKIDDKVSNKFLKIK